MTTWQAANQFQDLRRCESVLAPFDGAAALLAHLPHPGADLDHKDNIYAALVHVARARAPCSRLAHALLWCGLWPGLDRLYRRRLRYFESKPDELMEAIAAAFTALIARIDLARVQRIAATLVRSTDREVMYERRRVLDELAVSAAGVGALPSWLAPPSGGNNATQSSGLSFASELVMLRERLVPVVGADVDLLLTVLVLDTDQHEAAALLGLSHEAARKRVQRALRRVRAHLQLESTPLSFSRKAPFNS